MPKKCYNIPIYKSKDIKMANNQNKKSCSSCLYSAYFDSMSLECHRHAPVAPAVEGATQFPIVGHDCFCGDYEPKQVEKQAM